MNISIKTTYKVGDHAWFWVGSNNNRRKITGQVVARMKIPRHLTEFFIIETAEEGAPNLIVRDALRLASTEDGLAPIVDGAVPSGKGFLLNEGAGDE